MLLPSSLTHSNREGFEVRMRFEVRGVARRCADNLFSEYSLKHSRAHSITLINVTRYRLTVTRTSAPTEAPRTNEEIRSETPARFVI